MTRQQSQYTVRWQGLILSICLLALALAYGPRVARAAVPTLALMPDRGPCTTQIMLKGSDFSAGQVVNLTAGVEGSNQAVRFASPTVAADGTFTLQVDMRRIEGGCGVNGVLQLPEGTRYRIIATTDEQLPQLLATAFFTLASSSSSTPGLPNTGGGGTARDERPWMGGLGLLLLATLGRTAMLRRRT